MKLVLVLMSFLCFSVGLVFLGCGKGELLEPPAAGTNDMIYAVGIGESRTLRIAKKMAMQRSRAELALVAEANVTALAKDFEEQIGGDARAQINAAFSLVSQSLADGVLKETRVIETQENELAEGLFRVQILLAMPIKANLEDPLVKEISQDEALYQEFQAWKGHNELSKKVKALREQETQP